MSEAGFTEIPRIGVGMLGYAFMGKAHANAYKTLAYMTWPPPLVPELVAIAGRTPDAVAEAAARYGFADHVTDWNAIVADDRIGLFDNVGPNNLHAARTRATRRGSASRRPGSSTCARSTTGSCPPCGSRAR